MANTGMTRRIDELGRLVIPKEIRKNLKIKDNDQVEINVIDNKIILNKYDSFNKDRVVNIIILLLKKVLNRNILFTSREKIIDYVYINKKEEHNYVLQDEIVNIIENRNDVINYSFDNLIYNIFPLIINGDLYGSIIVSGNNDITNQDLEIIKFSKMFLENYLE